MTESMRRSYNQQQFDDTRRSYNQQYFDDEYTRRSYNQRYLDDEHASTYNQHFVQSDYYDQQPSIKDWEDRRKEESQIYEKMMKEQQKHQSEYYYSSEPICDIPYYSYVDCYNKHIASPKSFIKQQDEDSYQQSFQQFRQSTEEKFTSTEERSDRLDHDQNRISTPSQFQNHEDEYARRINQQQATSSRICQKFILNRQNLSFPVFRKGDDPQIWIHIANQHFDLYQVPIQYKVSLSESYIDDEVKFYLKSSSDVDVSWEDWGWLLYEEFNKSQYGFNEERFKEHIDDYNNNCDKINSIAEEKEMDNFFVSNQQKDGEQHTVPESIAPNLDVQPQSLQEIDSTPNRDEHISSDSFTRIAYLNSELEYSTLVITARNPYGLIDEDRMFSNELGKTGSGIDEELDNKIVVDFGKDVQMDNKMNDAQPLFDKMFERLENAHHMFDIMLVRGIENDGHKISVVMGKALKLFGEFSQREGFVYDLLAQVVEQTYRALLMRIVDQMYDVLLLHGGEQTYMKLLVFVVESHDVLLNIASKSAQYSASWQGNAQPTYLFFSFLAMHSIRVAHKFHHAHTETVVKDTSEDTGVKTLHRHNKKGGNITDQFGRVTDNIEVVSIRIKHYRLALHKNCMRAFEDVVRNKEACGGLLFHEYATGKAEISAGTPLRRYNELALKKEIQELLAGWKLFKITYTSDYFQERYDLTVELIRRGLACVDHQTGKEIKEYNIQIHGKLQVVEQRVELIKCSIKWLFSSSFVGIFWCCTHICDLHQAKAIGVPGTSSPFTDDAVSVAASIKYHAEFTAASSPEGFELNKAYFAAAQSVRDQTAMSRIMMLEDKHELKERDLSCPCILNGMKRHRFVANSQQQKSMPGTCLN